MNAHTQDHAVIIGYARTPFAKAAIPGSGKPPGRFADVDPVDMLVPLINTLIDSSGIAPAKVTKLLTGCVHQEADQGLNIARIAVMHPDCKLPNTVTGTSLDMFCASSLDAINMGAALSLFHKDSVYICSGVQTMSHVPMGGFNPHLNPQVHDGNAAAFMDMPATAENLAIKYKIQRQEQDEFSVRSHQRHAAAAKAGHFKNEIVPINGLDHDDGVRPDSTVESLSKLRPVAKDAKEGGTVTAASASQITDGASAVMVTAESYAKANNLPILARIIAVGESGCAPEIMGIGPVEASKRAFEKSGLTLKDMDYIELNEAFAAQSIAVIKEWEAQGMEPDMEKINVNGGAIAIGHPLGATGARLAGTLALELQRNNKRYGMATLCVGGGQGMAMIIENPAFEPSAE
ncbi:MAG: acetyl-CoA C-acyltransferase [Micavibrio sp.]|nr:acetyl-CoA C-acyltransferase [Micavibrio sp.]|tara:strand:+ start:2057 stop:3268 length:1212 start_codon:yes stop_codon:yes gene_type:complete